MIQIALYEPEIPPNTGNIIRLCANTGAKLHLIHPLGFVWEDKRLQRAGLDYHELTAITHHRYWNAFLTEMAGCRIFAFTTKGTKNHTEATYAANDVLLFGPETRGLPDSVLQMIGADNWLKIPMRKNSRSLNLSNAVAIAVYEAWRQANFR